MRIRAWLALLGQFSASFGVSGPSRTGHFTFSVPFLAGLVSAARLTWSIERAAANEALCLRKCLRLFMTCPHVGEVTLIHLWRPHFQFLLALNTMAGSPSDVKVIACHILPGNPAQWFVQPAAHPR